MDLLQVAKLINQKINAIEEERNKLETFAIDKARFESEYDKDLAVTIIKLKTGSTIEVDGNEIVNPPATIIERIARGAVWQAKLKYETANGRYKAVTSNISALESQLNGYQSINRYLSEVEK
jgi:hypothetical protein